MSLLFSEYHKHVKEFRLEEPCDYLIYRPLAFVIVKASYSLPLTPNHFSLMALTCAVIAGLKLSTGLASDMAMAGVLIFLFSTFDCCDGIVARSKKNGSKYGTFIDMLVDLISNIFLYVGIFLNLKHNSPSHFVPYLSFVCGLFIFQHASLFHFYKKQFLCYLNKVPDGRHDEIEKYRKDLLELNSQPGHFFEKLLLRAFLLFSKIQKDDGKIVRYKLDEYPKANQNILPLWGVIAGSTHLTVMAFALVIKNIYFYFYFALIFSNIWMAITALIQKQANAGIVEGV